MTDSTFTVDLGALELREASNGAHELEGICVPFDRTTTKAGPRPERFKRGAFADLADPSKVRLTDENHARGRRPVGVGVAFEERSAGLWGRFRFYNTSQGRDAWENVREGTYGGLSVGFHAVADAIEGGVRSILRARLHHVSLVDDPAYDDAQVIAVRSAADEFAWLREPPKVTLDVRHDPDFTSLIARLNRTR
jgi:HK97 family phage prohead protease